MPVLVICRHRRSRHPLAIADIAQAGYPVVRRRAIADALQLINDDYQASTSAPPS
jgi:hypothetical protein